MANIIPNYMQQVNAQNWAEGLGSVVQALNNPQAFANADLLRAKKAEIEASIAYQQGKLGLERQTTAAQLPVFAAQANNQNSQAAEHNAQARNADLVGQQLQLQTKAMMGLGSRLKATGMADADAELAQDVVISGSTKSTSENNADAINKIGRRDPLSVGNNVFWGVNDPRKPQPDVDSGAASLFPQSQTPFNQGGGFGTTPLLPQQGGASAPLAVGPAGNLAGQPRGPVTVGNVTTVPGSASRSMTPLNKKRDEVWGTALAEYDAKGGSADAETNLAKLDNAIGKLTNDKTTTGVSGVTTGILPDIVNRKIGNADAVDARQSVESAVSDTLRATLGAAFTAEEGRRTLKLAYDPYAEPKENARRVKLVSELLKSKTQTMKDAAAYAEANGTMDGFKAKGLGSHKSFNDELEAAIKNPNAGSSTAATTSQEKFTVGQAYTSNGITKIYRGGGKWESAQ